MPDTLERITCEIYQEKSFIISIYAYIVLIDFYLS